MKKFFIRLWHIIAAPYYWIQDKRLDRLIKEMGEDELTEKDEEVFNKFVEKYCTKK